jgi:hypothetical protein
VARFDADQLAVLIALALALLAVAAYRGCQVI